MWPFYLPASRIPEACAAHAIHLPTYLGINRPPFTSQIYQRNVHEVMAFSVRRPQNIGNVHGPGSACLLVLKSELSSRKQADGDVPLTIKRMAPNGSFDAMRGSLQIRFDESSGSHCGHIDDSPASTVTNSIHCRPLYRVQNL
jgi:hypothetical protein